jgi:DNA-binding GntR family transcriptional regulator
MSSDASPIVRLDIGSFDRQSMADRAYGELKHRILYGEFEPGQGMLEEEIAASLGMSRTPVREATVRLAQEGLVEIVPRKGIRVTQLTARGVREIHEVLACLEIQAAERLAARKLAPTDMERLDATVLAMDAALNVDDLDAWASADYAFHQLLIELAGNRHLEAVARGFLEKAQRWRMAILPIRGKPIRSTTSHAALVEAIRRGDTDSAAEIHRLHKRRCAREIEDLVERLGLPAGD